jgi:hypothetical protein
MERGKVTEIGCMKRTMQHQQGKRSCNRTRKHASPKPEDPNQTYIYEMYMIVKGFWGSLSCLGWVLDVVEFCWVLLRKVIVHVICIWFWVDC